MEWTSPGIILDARPHRETATILSVLTETQGRHAGLVPNGQTPRKAGLLQPGTLVTATWHARLADHLGTYDIDVTDSPVARWMNTPEILAIVASATAMTELCLPERQPLPGVYAGLQALLTLEDEALWAPVYIKWEMELLRALGYGLDLDACAVTGDTDDLSHVSPRTGRAVSKHAAAPYAPRLLRLPGFLRGEPHWTDQDILDGLLMTAHFLTRTALAHDHTRPPDQSPLPPARQRLEDLYRKKANPIISPPPRGEG